MVKKKVEAFDWKKFALGLKRPAIALLGLWLTTLAGQPQWAWVGGIGAERIWSTIEFYLKR